MQGRLAQTLTPSVRLLAAIPKARNLQNQTSWPIEESGPDSAPSLQYSPVPRRPVTTPHPEDSSAVEPRGSSPADPAPRQTAMHEGRVADVRCAAPSRPRSFYLQRLTFHVPGRLSVFSLRNVYSLSPREEWSPTARQPWLPAQAGERQLPAPRNSDNRASRLKERERSALLHGRTSHSNQTSHRRETPDEAHMDRTGALRLGSRCRL